MARKRVQHDPTGYTILVVDDEESARLSIRAVLEREGHAVLTAESGQRALELFARHQIHLLLVDYFMPRMTGEQLIECIRALDPDVQIVLQTGYAGEKPPREMLRSLDIQGYHDKTEGPDKLLLWVDIALKAYEHVHRVREAEILKSELLANVSHEFRTPLHIILGYLELLADEVGAVPAATDALARVRRNAETLLRLVDDFLRLSDLDSTAATARPDPVDWATLRADVTGLADQLIGDKPIRLAWEVPDGLPPVAADRTKLRLIIRHLLSNAVKFTDCGAITVGVELAGAQVVLLVRDTGMGIAPEHHERIFEAFHQVDRRTTRPDHGTGIGLATARKLARLMGGDITVRSTRGAGATFAVQLPLARPANEAGAPVPSLPVSGP